MSGLVGLIIGVLFAGLACWVTGRWGWVLLFIIGNIAYTWLNLPVLKYGFTDLPFLLFLNALILYLTSLPSSATGLKLNARQTFKSKSGKTGSRITGGLFGLSLIALFIWPFVTSFAGFHSKSYYHLPGPVDVGEFSEDVAAIDMSQVRRVDGSLARNLADKRLGEDRGLGSRVTVGRMSIQAVNGQLYWVGPLNHSKFRRWLDNRDGTPGYVMVSASNENDVRLVTELAGKPLALRYNQGAYFTDKPARYAYDHGYAAHGLTDWTFEIDDTGRPFYVITDYSKKVGFKGADAVGVIVLDVQNGEIKDYPIEAAPKWIDRIQPAPLLRRQLRDWGRYKDGWVNSWLGADGVLKPTKGMSLVYGNDGQSYFYTGMQSVGSDEGTVGFILINTRSKQMKLYEQAGATETAARNSAEDEFQDFGYRAVSPILYNIGGVPTYFMTLKASSGLVKAAAFVSVEDYSLVGAGKTTETALRHYNQTLRGRGNFVAIGDVENYETIEGIAARVRQEVTGETATYYFLLEGKPDQIFAVPSDLAPLVRMTQAGDYLSLSFQNDGNGIVDVLAFENKALKLALSETQEAINARGDAENIP